MKARWSFSAWRMRNTPRAERSAFLFRGNGCKIYSSFSCSLDLYDVRDVVTRPATCRCVWGSSFTVDERPVHFRILRPLSTPFCQNPHFQTLHLQMEIYGALVASPTVSSLVCQGNQRSGNHRPHPPPLSTSHRCRRGRAVANPRVLWVAGKGGEASISPISSVLGRPSAELGMDLEPRASLPAAVPAAPPRFWGLGEAAEDRCGR